MVETSTKMLIIFAISLINQASSQEHYNNCKYISSCIKKYVLNTLSLVKIYDNFNDEYYDLYYDYYNANDFYIINQVHLPKALHLPNPVPEQLDVADVAKENQNPDEFFWRPMRSDNKNPKNQVIFTNYVLRHSFRT